MSSRKYRIINELREELVYDSTGETIPGNIYFVTYAPKLGYNQIIYKYKGVYVSLFDLGNGHRAFIESVSIIDVIVNKIACLYIQLRRNK